MLIMAWGGDSTAKIEQCSWLRGEIRRSSKEIHALGQDLQPGNVLLNDELGRALIIDMARTKQVGSHLRDVSL